MSIIPIRLEGELERQLRRIAGELKRSQSYVIKEAIREYLEDTVDYEIALARMKDKNDPVLTLEQFKKTLHGK